MRRRLDKQRMHGELVLPPVSLLLVIVLCSSAFAQYRIYWGDVHGHTSHSDGQGSLDDYFTYARDESNLDFVIVTDHDFGNSAPWRMPKETWALAQDKANEYTVEGSFVAIAGYEWTSQPKYWTDVQAGTTAERLFPGPPAFYNHKVVYLPSPVDYLFSANDRATMTPDLLAAAVLKHGGLVHNAHPTAGRRGKDQFDYDPRYSSVIANTEMGPDILYHQGTRYELACERILREFLNRGGKTGFVNGTDTHEGKPAARTALLAKELTRDAVFDALRHRRNFAVTNARIVLRFTIEGHEMGEEIEVEDEPEIDVDVRGTDTISEVAIVRDGEIIHARCPKTERVKFTFVDNSFLQSSYYYLRVTQVDKDEHGNPSRAWSSPIWVSRKPVQLQRTDASIPSAAAEVVAEAKITPWKSVFVGVEICEATTVTPLMLQVRAVRVDLREPSVRFLVTPSNGDKPLDCDARTTSQFLSEFGCQIAINGSVFHPFAEQSGDPQDVVGLAISQGEHYSPANEYDAILISRNREAWIDQSPVEVNKAYNGLSGFHALLVDGRNNGQMKNRHPRSAVGIGKDGQYR